MLLWLSCVCMYFIYSASVAAFQVAELTVLPVMGFAALAYGLDWKGKV